MLHDGLKKLAHLRPQGGGKKKSHNGVKSREMGEGSLGRGKGSDNYGFGDGVGAEGYRVKREQTRTGQKTDESN